MKKKFLELIFCRQTKKLEKRKQAVSSFLEKVEKDQPASKETPNSEVKNEEGIFENLSEIDLAIKRLEKNLS